MKCENCNTLLEVNDSFCYSCGFYHGEKKYKTEIVNKKYETELKEFIEKINEVELDKEVQWNKTLQKYTDILNKSKLILNEKELVDYAYESLFEETGKFIYKAKAKEFHIAFVGAIKAGKSTLINSFLDRNLASISVTPETAALTKFRASKDRDYIKLKFYNKKEWTNLWESIDDSHSDKFKKEYLALEADKIKNKWVGAEDKKICFENQEEFKKEIKKWTSSKKAAHYFVKEVEIGLKDFSLPERVVFIDTPGLNDPVEYRSKITREYIDKANAVLVCIQADAMTGQELSTIYRVFSNTAHNPAKVYIIGTKLDNLNKPLTDWKEQKSEWLKRLEEDACYGDQELAKNNLLSASAYMYNMLSQYDDLGEEIIDYELEPIAKKFRIKDIEDNLNELFELTNITKIKNKIKNEIISKHEIIFLNDLEEHYENIKFDLINTFKNIKNENKELLQFADEDIKEIKNKKMESLNRLKESKQEKEELEQTLREIKDLTQKRSQELSKYIEGLL
jgi:predicted GTPase